VAIQILYCGLAIAISDICHLKRLEEYNFYLSFIINHLTVIVEVFVQMR